MRLRHAAIAATLLLCACSNTPVRYAINIDRLNEVVGLIKTEIGAYITEYNQREADRQALRIQGPTTTCNNGQLDFRLTEVSIELTTTRVANVGGSASIALPIAPASSIGFGLSGANTTTNSQVLKFGSVILPNSLFNDPVKEADRPRYQLLNTLNALRLALLAGAANGPCFDAARAEEGFENTFSIGFKVKDELGGGIKILLAAITLARDAKQVHTVENLITVSFAPREPPAAAARQRPRRPGVRPPPVEPAEPESYTTWRLRRPLGTGWFY